MEKTTVEISRDLRNRLTAKKNILNLKKLEFVIERMYDKMNELNLWGDEE